MSLPIKDRTIVLTGAASGIGASLARALASHQPRLALIDIDAPALTALAATLPTPTRTYAVDVTNPQAIATLPQLIADDLGPAAILINNAGIALAGRFDQVTEAQFDRVLQTNFTATVNLTRLFLPQLRANPPAQIVNMSSIFGIVGIPGNVAYCSSKFAVRGFSEALRLELAPSNIGITVIHPGGVRTNIARNSAIGPGVTPQARASMQQTAEKFLRLSPDKAAHKIVQALIRRKKRQIIGADARLLTALQRLFPVSYAASSPKTNANQQTKGFPQRQSHPPVHPSSNRHSERSDESQ